MSDRGWVGWVVKNRLIVGGVALVTAIALTIVAVAAGGGDDKKKVASRKGDTSTGPGDLSPVPGGVDTTLPGGAGGTGGTGGGPGGSATPGQKGGPGVTVPGVPKVLPGNVTLPPCVAQKGFKATGIDERSVTVGQIVTDVNALPQQLKPNKEGLEAYVKLANAAGGVCGREIKIDYENDNLNPATHNYEAMARRVFAFVANSSLLDGNDYQTEPPFNPKFTDNGQFVPDIGGLALTYGRSQSPWHAGAVGSISPTLVGGAAFRTAAQVAASQGHKCAKAAIVYLQEPTGASSDQAHIGEVAIRSDWGANVGTGNTKYYVANLAQPEPVYEVQVNQMISDGMNCVFTYMDLGSNVNLVQAMAARGVWPPDKCKLGPKCFGLVAIPFAGYDTKFIRDGGDGAKSVFTFLPHLPLNETSGASMRAYLDALRKIPGATPSTFSIIGFASGQMLVQALGACGAAPTRVCVMNYLRGLKDFNAGGLLGGTTPFRTTRAKCGDCGNFQWKGTYNWKWIFPCFVPLQVSDRAGKRDFYRVGGPGYTCDSLRVARGSPA